MRSPVFLCGFIEIPLEENEEIMNFHFFGMGTVVNMAAIILGGILGMVGGSFISQRFQDTLLRATGLCVLFLGIGGAMEKMLTITEGRLSSGGTMMMVVSFAVGSLVGEAANLEEKLEQFGQWLKEKSGNAGDGGFVNAFVTASLTVCVGAMAVVGSIQDGLLGDSSVLILKAMLDFIIILVMASSMGKGCAFSAIPVGIFQGGFTLLSKAIEPLMTPAAMDNLSLTGSILIFCVGVNLIHPKTFKVVNMLPTIVVAVIWALVM